MSEAIQPAVDTKESPGSGDPASRWTLAGRRRVVQLALSIGLAALVLAPVAFSFYRALAALPGHLRIGFTGVAVAMLALGGLLVRVSVRPLGAARYGLLVAPLLLGWSLYSTFEVQVASADLAQVGYSDGRLEPDVPPSPKSAWGRNVDGYGLHPSFDATVVPNSLVATFSARPTRVQVLFAKPREGLFQLDGRPVESDGISIDLQAFDGEGNPGFSESFVIPQEEFLAGDWVEKDVRVAAGIASIRISTGWGPPGGTPYGDFTLVGFQVPDWKAQVDLIGRLMLVCLGAYLLLLLLVLGIEGMSGARAHRFHGSGFAQGGLVLALVLLFVCWSQGQSNYVYFWDYRNYWDKTETLYGLFRDGAWKQAIDVFASAYTSNYSMLPAVPSAALSLVTGEPSRVNYALSIAMLYSVPAYLMVAYLAQRMLGDGAPMAGHSSRNRWALSSLAVMVSLPTFFGVTLYLMPDIGGVVLAVAALLSASSLVGAIREPWAPTQRGQVSTALLRSAVSVGVLFGLMFVFRRWYVFFAAGIAAALLLAVVVEAAFARGDLRAFAWRAVAGALLVAFSALPFFCWFLFAWSRDFGQHDYSNLYASYRFSLRQDLAIFTELFGIVVPVLIAVGGVVLWVAGRQKRLLLMLVVATAVACVLFLKVQSPGPHHFYLLMPLFGSIVAGSFLLLARRLGAWAAVVLALLIGLGGALSTRPWGDKAGPALFAGYDDWKPRQQRFADGFSEISRWLAAPGNQERRFCLIASSVAINQGIFRELWQILPNVPKYGYDQRMIHMGQVDSVDGPPLPGVKECEIFLVGVPFQSHLSPDQQTTLSIMQRDLLEGTGIGAAVDRQPRVFTMGDGIQVLGFRTHRGISDQEYDDLVKRFRDEKAASGQ